jgi:ribonuclease HI
MRVFTDGACSGNGKSGARAGFAVWFPEHPELGCAERVPTGEAQTNQRGELRAIHRAAEILDVKGYHDEDIIIYTDSEYSINCLTKWIPGWMSRNWKTTDGKDVLHQDLIRGACDLLAKFKSHRFVHVRAHTGGVDDLSKNNDIVDRMARGTLDDSVKTVIPPVVDDLFEGCPLRILGPPVAQSDVLSWVRANLSVLDRDIVDKYLLKAFTDVCKARDVTLTKHTVSKTQVLRAERGHLQIDRVVIEKKE